MRQQQNIEFTVCNENILERKLTRVECTARRHLQRRRENASHHLARLRRHECREGAAFRQDSKPHVSQRDSRSTGVGERLHR